MKRIVSAIFVPVLVYFAVLQLNDPDWYVWFSVYAFSALLLLLNTIYHTLLVSRTMLYTAALLHVWGMLLLAWSLTRLLSLPNLTLQIFYQDEELREAAGLLICVTLLYFTRFAYGKNYPADRDPKQDDFIESDLTSPYD